jgi:hypothetical protein
MRLFWNLRSFSKTGFLLFFLLPISHSLFSFTLDETLTALAPISKNVTPQFYWDPLFQDGVFNLGNHSCAFSTAAREGETGFIIFNNQELFTVPLPYRNNDKLDFPEAFVVTLKNTFTRALKMTLPVSV